MRWGVRRQRRLARLTRVGAGQGSMRDHLTVLRGVNIARMIVKGGYKRGVRSKVGALEGRKERIAIGETTVRDLLFHVGSKRMPLDFRPLDAFTFGKNKK